MSDALVQTATIQNKAQAGGGFGSVPDGGLSGGTLALAWSAAALGNGSEMTLTTNLDFGISVSTRLYDIGDRVVEKGVDNNYHSTFIDDQNVYGSSSSFGANADPSAIYFSPNTDAGNYEFLKLSRTRAHRHSFVDSHYYDYGFGGFVGNPNALGGEFPETGHTKLYTAWRLKLNWDFRKLHFFSYTGKTGTFSMSSTIDGLGEALTLTSADEANIIYDDGSTIGFYTPNKTDTDLNVLNGTVVSGNVSGASITLSSTDGWNGAEKILRIRDKGDGTAGSGTWNQNSGQIDIHQAPTAKIWTLMNEAEWALMESEFDKTAGTWDVFINGTKLWSIAGITAPYDPTLSMMISSIGWQGVRADYNVVEFGEIYTGFDFKRVYIGDAATWGACTKREIQIVKSWSTSQILLEQYQGELSNMSGSYLYVADGYPLDADTGVLI